jgi:hypothetical protein
MLNKSIIVVGAGNGNQRGLTALVSSYVRQFISNCVSMNSKEAVI